MRLVWELLVLHLKLATEAIRDIFLSPVSIIAVIAGLLAAGDEMVRPIEESLLAQTRPGGRFERGAGHVNQLLDAVNKKSAGPPRDGDR